MQKLSKALNDVNIEKENVIIFDSDDIKIIGDGDSNLITQKDKIYILPYLLYNNCILLKDNVVKSYKTRLKNDSRYKNINSFLTVFSTEIKDNETLNDSCRRLLYNDLGMLLSNMVELEFEYMFFDDKNTAMNYFILLKLNESQYQMTIKEENDIRVKYLDILNIEDFIPIDIQTKYLIEKLKNIIK